MGLIIERKARRIFKVLKGTYLTATRKGAPLRPEYWDNLFYTQGISDARTIGSQKKEFSSRYHYASVETLILRYLVNNKIDRIGRVLDLGSGAGHWIDFYMSLDAEHCTGLEVSEKCVEYMKEKYFSNGNINIEHGTIKSVLESKSFDKFDVVSAIGVLFHIVEDDELVECLSLIYQSSNADSLFVIGGNFGIWPMNINTQVRSEGIINKRLRSRWWWIRELRNVGFHSFQLYRNFGYAFIKDRTPENSLLVCKK